MSLRKLEELNREELRSVLTENSKIRREVMYYVTDCEARNVDDILKYIRDSFSYCDISFYRKNTVEIRDDRDFIAMCIKASEECGFLNDYDVRKFDATLKEIDDFRDNFSIKKVDGIKQRIIECEDIALEKLEKLTDLEYLEEDFTMLLDYFQVMLETSSEYAVDEKFNVYKLI